jgi:hypothetical protein
MHYIYKKKLFSFLKNQNHIIHREHQSEMSCMRGWSRREPTAGVFHQQTGCSRRLDIFPQRPDRMNSNSGPVGVKDRKTCFHCRTGWEKRGHGFSKRGQMKATSGHARVVSLTVFLTSIVIWMEIRNCYRRAIVLVEDNMPWSNFVAFAFNYHGDLINWWLVVLFWIAARARNPYERKFCRLPPGKDLPACM